MRRPMVFILLAYAGGIMVGFLFQYAGRVPVGGLVFILVLILTVARGPDKTLLRPFLWVFLLGCLYFILYSANADSFRDLDGKQVTITGEVISVQKPYDEYYKLELSAETYYHAGRIFNIKEKMLVNLKGALDYVDAEDTASGLSSYADLVGRHIQIKGLIDRPPAAKNPRLFDYRLYLKTRNINTILESNTWQCTLSSEKVNVIANGLSRYKFGLLSRLENNMSLEAFGLMAGILFGDKNFIGDDIYQAFQKNGTSHILSVSGIHVGIIYAFIDRAMGKGKHPLYNGITVGLLLIYAALSGFSPSVNRAVFMIIVFIIGKGLQERYDLTTCTAFTAFVLLLLNPYYLFNLGFQLSYIAVFILAVIMPWFTSQIGALRHKELSDPPLELKSPLDKKMREKMLYLMLPLIAIQIGMIPITAYFFNYFSLSAFIINVPVIMLAGIILPIGLFLMIISLLLGFSGNGLVMNSGGGSIPGEIGKVLDFIFSLLSTASELLIWIMIELNKLTAIRGFGYFDIQNPSAVTLVVYYVLLFLLCSELGQNYFKKLKLADDSMQRRKEKAFSAILIVLLLLICMIIPKDSYRNAELVFIDVGQGDCLHIRTPMGKNILIDGGGSRDLAQGIPGYDVGTKTLLPYLLKNGVSKVDIAIVSHLHDDHLKGLTSLSQVMKIDKVIVYSENQTRQITLQTSLRIDPEELLFVQRGSRIIIEPGIYLDVLYPEGASPSQDNGISGEADYLDENAKNLLLRLNYNGVTILMTGDLTGEDELGIIEKGLDVKADILKVPHHGSRYSSTEAFILAVDPVCAIIQVGKNNFGHPNPGIIESYEKKGIMIYRTDEDGAVLLDIMKDKRIGIRTMLNPGYEILKL